MSCISNSSNINETFIIEPITVDDTPILSACTALYSNNIISCSGNTEIQLSTDNIIFNGNLYTDNDLTASNINVISSIVPTQDNIVNIGTPLNRFRDINVYSGVTSIWSATTIVHSPILDLGLDSLGNNRILTADSSILDSDVLLGGSY